MKHKLRAVAIVGLAIVVAGAVVRPAALESLTRFAPRPSSALASVQQWLQQATSHLTTTQYVECAGVAWCIFVVALVLLARSKRNVPREPKPRRESTKAVPAADAKSPSPARMPERPVSQPHSAPVDSLGAGDKAASPSPTSPTRSPIVMPVASDLAVERRARAGSQPVHQRGMRDAPMVRRNHGHVLALTGLSASADGRLLPYGLFVVAEDVGAPHTGSQASQRAVEVIAEQVVPALTTQRVPESEQLTALLKMAVMRAGMELWRQGTRSTMDLGAAMAGVVIRGDTGHVVNVGDCRTYLFRPRTGLVQIAANHGAVGTVSDVTGDEPPPIESWPVYASPPRDEIYHSVGDDALSAAVGTFEVSVHPDDLLLLCSPGLWKALRHQEIETILGGVIEPTSAAEILACEGASRAPEGSNMNVIVMYLPRDRIPRFGVPAPRASLS
jgi:serine/threonine protein phosphatase PrpC